MNHAPIVASLAVFLALAPRAGAADAPAKNPLDRGDAAEREWKEKLGLSSGQASKFLSAVKARDAELQPLRERQRADMQKLQSQLSDGAAEIDVRDTLERLARTREEISRRSDRFDSATASFLTPSQRAKLLVWKSLGTFPGKCVGDLEADDSRDLAPEAEAELE